MIEKDKNNQELLKQNWELLMKSLGSLKLSVEKVSNIDRRKLLFPVFQPYLVHLLVALGFRVIVPKLSV